MYYRNCFFIKVHTKAKCLHSVAKSFTNTSPFSGEVEIDPSSFIRGGFSKKLVKFTTEETDIIVEFILGLG